MVVYRCRFREGEREDEVEGERERRKNGFCWCICLFLALPLNPQAKRGLQRYSPHAKRQGSLHFQRSISSLSSTPQVNLPRPSQTRGIGYLSHFLIFLSFFSFFIFLKII